MQCCNQPNNSILPDYFSKFKEKIEQLKYDIQYTNRFFTRNPIQKDIEFAQELSTTYIDSETELWRARVLNNHDICKFSIPLSDDASLSNLLNDIFKDSEPFWGYKNPEDCLAPPPDIAPDNRANPRFISYLYTALDIDTAIAEIRPIPGSKISLAKIVPSKVFKIYDLTNHGLFSPNQDSFNEFYRCLSNAFSTPVHGDLSDYLVTQYIAEFIKSLDFDGVKYYSAQRGFEQGKIVGKGSNITLFYQDNLQVTETRVFHINNIEISSSQILPAPNK